MPIIIFAFTFNPETKEGAMAGNIDPVEAAQLLQQLAIADAIQKAQKPAKTKKEEKK